MERLPSRDYLSNVIQSPFLISGAFPDDTSLKLPYSTNNPQHKHRYSHVLALPFSYGVFQDYYSKTPPFSSHADGIAIVGTCATGILYLGGSLVYAAIHLFPPFQKYSSLLGIAIMSLSLVLASFATTVWQLILTQGVMFAIGGCLLLYTTVYFLDGWFVKRKGLAFGVLCTGNGMKPLCPNMSLEFMY